MYYECSGSDVSSIITKLNSKLDSSSQLSSTASVAEIVAAIDTMLTPIIDLANTKATTTVSTSSTVSDIVAAFKTVKVSVDLRGRANYENGKWQAELYWTHSSNTGHKYGEQSTEDSQVTTTQSFDAF